MTATKREGARKTQCVMLGCAGAGHARKAVGPSLQPLPHGLHAVSDIFLYFCRFFVTRRLTHTVISTTDDYLSSGSYVGEWHNDKREGYGTQIYGSGDK